jgi:hypothetical protein
MSMHDDDPDESELSPHYRLASLLEESGIKSCVVGEAVTMYYGSNQVLPELHIVIADEQFDGARAMLRSSGYEEIELREYHHFPTVLRQLQYRLLCYPETVVMAPASMWHLEIDDSTTFLLPNTSIRMPHFLAYLRGAFYV